MLDPELQRLFADTVDSVAMDHEAFVERTMRRVDAASRGAWWSRLVAVAGGAMALAVLAPASGGVVSSAAVGQQLQAFDQLLATPLVWLVCALGLFGTAALRRSVIGRWI